MPTAPRPPEILRPERTDEAIQRLNHYFHEHESYPSVTGDGPRMTTLPLFSGSRFDDFGREAGDANTITAADLLSLSFLSVDVSGTAALGILEQSGQEITALLQELPTDRDLHDLTDDEFEQLLGSRSPGQRLWDILRAHHLGTAWGMGPTKVSKLLARKRPRLVPIWDELIGGSLGLQDSSDHWRRMRRFLDSDALVAHLGDLRDNANLDPAAISLLRIFDVTVWHAAKFQRWPVIGPAD